MLLGFELEAADSIPFQKGYFVSTSIYIDGNLLLQSRGEDYFHFPGTVIREHRFAATGRVAHYQLGKMPGGLSVFEAKANIPVGSPRGSHCQLFLQTNFLSDKNCLGKKVKIAGFLNGIKREITLQNNNININQTETGSFFIDLTPALKH